MTEGASLREVWDLPTRLFHWLLATLILFSWWSVKNDHTGWHIWSGCAILTLLVFRLLWGVFGSSTARFTNFIRGPRAIRDDLSGKWEGIGHSPLGGISVLLLFAVIAVQVGLGLISEDEDGLYMGPLARLVSPETSDRARDLHELWFNVILFVVIVHVAAILYYRLRGRPLTKAMITGKTSLSPATQSMRPGKWWAALLCLAAGIAVTRWVIAGAPPFGS